MNNTATPITDEAWAAWPYAGSGISVHVGRELERELTAVTEQLDGLREGIDYATNQLTKVKKQRDRLAEALRGMLDVTSGQAIYDFMSPQRLVAKQALQSLNKPTETKTK